MNGKQGFLNFDVALDWPNRAVCLICNWSGIVGGLSEQDGMKVPAIGRRA